ncbi:hypothetical protein [Siccibacter colletis]|uniref:hypothetical protein n=1 Tax=Siccibacter colletis TaxID=1505757 RepID=UPI0004E119E7|nr:hypothetical protein [Siccibacter colletis]
MTLSKERLEEIAELARKENYKPCAMHMTNLIAVCDSEVIEEMARRLLAAEAQDPVGFLIRDKYTPGGYFSHKNSTVNISQEDICEHEVSATPLYAAPQVANPVQDSQAVAYQVALQNFRIAMEGIGHIRRTLEETFGGLHGTHAEPDVLVECKAICDAICEAYRQAEQPVQVPDENGNLPCPFCGGKCDAEGWMGSYDEGVPLCGPECEDCGATAISLKEWNRHTVMPAAAPQPESE